MADPLLHVGASVMCPHGGSVSTVPGNPRVLLAGQPTATATDQYPIAGCAFTLPGPKPSPCLTVRWLRPAARVLAGGQRVILTTSQALCLSPEQAPQGPPNVTASQISVKGL